MAKNYLYCGDILIFHQNGNSRSNYNYNLWHYTDIKYISHFHRNFELVFVKSGEILANIGGKDELLKSGDYALVLSNQVHSYRTENKSECWIVVFSEEFVPKFASMIKNRQGDTAKFNLSDSTHQLVQSKLNCTDTSVMMKKACFYAVCDEYLKQTSLFDKRSNDIKVGNILDFIAEHYTEDLTLEFVAQKFGYEYHYLSRLLNKYYRINFREVINEYRIEAAKGLLTSENLKITDISSKCGFQSIRSFNYVFKHITGCSPKEYIKLIK